MSNEIRLLLTILTCYRLAQLVTLDDVFKRLRKSLNTKASLGNPIWKSVAELAHCPYCIGLWFAVPVAGLYQWDSIISTVILLVLGIAGGQAALQGRDTDDA